MTGHLVVGTRVVVRRRLPDGRLGDLLGTLLAADATSLVVRTRHGDVTVAVADVVAAKAVPPRATRRGPAHLALSVRDLEDVMADGWRAPETAWLDGPGSWLLRAAEGFTGRANSALALRPTSAPLAEALDRVAAWYADRALPATVALAEPLHDADEAPVPGLRGALDAAGWLERSPTRVMVASALAVPPVQPPPGLVVQAGDRPNDGWLSLYRYRGQALPEIGLRLLLSAPHQEFVAVRDAGTTVAVGRLAVSRAWGGVTAMEVAPSHRRRGLARVVLGALARRSAALGARALYLQVAEENEAGRALYAGSGFTDHHRYAYWSPAR